MEPSQPQSPDFVARLADLGGKDRKAVLALVTADERHRIETALQHSLKEQRAEEERQRRIDRQFLGYSPWLASLVEQAQDSAPETLTDPCAKALWDVHSAKVSAGMSVTRSGWRGFMDRCNDWLKTSRKGVQ